MPPRPARRPRALYVGVDLGTSGCRAVAVDAEGTVRAAHAVDLPAPERDAGRSERDPGQWWNAACTVLRRLTAEPDAGEVAAVAVDGTAATVLLADRAGRPLTPALLYDDARSRLEAERIARAAPADSPARGATSGLAKLLHLMDLPAAARAHHVLHAADWVAGRLCGRFGFSDVNHCLKLGYDVQLRRWPQWLDALGVPRDWLPRVLTPGAAIGPVSDAASALGLSPGTQVIAGTTDSTAAFLATGAHGVGEAVTSLGSTLVLKILAPAPVFSAAHGVYSQPLDDAWLAGGASNSGGAVLRRFFDQAALERMTPLLRPERATGLDYYPLPALGERFPVADPELPPRMTPRPHDDVEFFQGLLEGIAAIEAAGYRLLARLGAPRPVSVRTVGGGARNAAWTRIRARHLQVPVIAAEHEDAAYGAALLARRGAGGRSRGR